MGKTESGVCQCKLAFLKITRFVGWYGKETHGNKIIKLTVQDSEINETILLSILCELFTFVQEKKINVLEVIVNRS